MIAREKRREDIFTGDGDKEKFLVKLAESAEKFRLLIHAYVLKEIGTITKMDYAAVSELARSFERDLGKEMKYQRLAKHFEKEIS